MKFLASSQHWTSFIKCWTNNSPQGLANFQDRWVALLRPALILCCSLKLHTQKVLIVAFFFQISADSSQSVSFKLEQLTKLLYSIEDKVKYLRSPRTILTCFGHVSRWFYDKPLLSVFSFRLKVLCLSLLDMKVVTGNLSYQLLHLRCFSKFIIVSCCRKNEMTIGLQFIWSVLLFT